MMGPRDALLAAAPGRRDAHEALHHHAQQLIATMARAHFASSLQDAASEVCSNFARQGFPRRSLHPVDDPAAMAYLRQCLVNKAISLWRKANPAEAKALRDTKTRERSEKELALRAKEAARTVDAQRAIEDADAAVEHERKNARRRPRPMADTVDYDLAEMGRGRFFREVVPLFAGCADDDPDRRMLLDLMARDRAAWGTSSMSSLIEAEVKRGECTRKAAANFLHNRFRLASKRLHILLAAFEAEGSVDDLREWWLSLRSRRSPSVSAAPHPKRPS